MAEKGVVDTLCFCQLVPSFFKDDWYQHLFFVLIALFGMVSSPHRLQRISAEKKRRAARYPVPQGKYGYRSL
jgi:hypothetical protein